MEWMATFDRLTWKGELFNTFTQIVIDINRQGKDLWRRWMKDDKKLFEGTNRQGPASVFFLDGETFRSETAAEQEADLGVSVLSSRQIMADYPALRTAINEEVVVGGLIIDSFALNAISLGRNIINALRKNGSRF